MATYPIKMLKDENGTPFVPLISLDSVQDTAGQSINEILDKKLEATNLVAGTQIELEVDGNNITISNSAEGTKLIDNLETEQAGVGALDAHQGKALLEKIPTIANNLNTPESGQALSAYQGYVLAGRVAPTGGAEGQVLKKASTDDYDFEWGDAADPNAIVGDGSIMKIIELTYEEYLELESNGQLQDDTEYHINNWTESGHSEITATQVTTVEGSSVQEKLNNIDLINEGQNTRLDIAEDNIDVVVNTVNTHTNTLAALKAEDVSAAVTPYDEDIATLGAHSKLIKYGPVYTYQFSFTTKTALSANTAYTVGVISSSHRPNITNASIQGLIRANNDIYVSTWISEGSVQIYPPVSVPAGANLAGNFSWTRL